MNRSIGQRKNSWLGVLLEGFEISLTWVCSNFRWGQVGVWATVSKVGEAFCLLSFQDKEERQLFMMRYADMFEC